MTTTQRNILSGVIEPEMSFREKVWAVTARIPKGKVVTYGDIAKALGSSASRAVGTAMAVNPYIPDVPCHRVVRSSGSLGEYAYGQDKKAELLASEDVEVTNGRIDLKQYRYELASI